jgi:hypothetical protein
LFRKMSQTMGESSDGFARLVLEGAPVHTIFPEPARADGL